MSVSGHLDDEVLERYAMGTLTESEAEAVEDHLALCSICLDRLDEATGTIEELRAALSQNPSGLGKAGKSNEESKTWLPVWLSWPTAKPLAWAGGSLACAAILLVAVRPAFLNPSLPLGPVAIVVLDGTRGASKTVSGTGPFDFQFFMPVSADRYQAELLDASGSEKWRGEATHANAGENLHAVVNKALEPGQYFLRVTERKSNTVRDFGFLIKP